MTSSGTWKRGVQNSCTGTGVKNRGLKHHGQKEAGSKPSGPSSSPKHTEDSGYRQGSREPRGGGV